MLISAFVAIVLLGVAGVALNAAVNPATDDSSQVRLRRNSWMRELMKVPAAMYLVGAVFGGLGAFMAYATVKSGLKGPFQLSFHESGVRRAYQRGGREELLRYADATGLTYGVQVAQDGTTRMLDIEGGGMKFGIMSNGESGGSPIEQVRDLAITAVAERMSAQLGAGQTVSWTNKLALTPAGVAVSGSVTPWEQLGGSQADDEKGNFRLFARGNPTPLAVEKMTAKNFLPGLEVYRAMTGDQG